MKTYTQILSLFLGSIALILAMQTPAESLKKTFQAAKGGEYQPPTAAEIKIAEKLFLFVLQGQRGENLRKAWAQQGFIMRTLIHKGIPFIAIQEMENQRTGRGFYLFRQKGSLPLALQSPHTYYDRFTRHIGRKLMRDGHYAALAWNTVSRHDADMAHLDHTIFQAFTRAFAQRYPKGTIVQLHGFSQQKRKSRRAQAADMILSNTFNTPSERVLMAYRCLSTNLSNHVVRLYPYEIMDLGGLGNRNAKTLLEHGFKNFVHIEMSLEMRRRLRYSSRVRRQFSACLQARSFSSGPIIMAKSANGQTRSGYNLLWVEPSEVMAEYPESLLWRLKGDDRLIGEEYAYQSDAGMRLRREANNQQKVLLPLKRRVSVLAGTEVSIMGMLRIDGQAKLFVRLKWYSKIRRGGELPQLAQQIELEVPAKEQWFPFRVDLIVPSEAKAVKSTFQLLPPESGEATADFDHIRLVAWGRANESSQAIQATEENHQLSKPSVKTGWATALLPELE
jgi:hypothetical protein